VILPTGVVTVPILFGMKTKSSGMAAGAACEGAPGHLIRCERASGERRAEGYPAALFI
jgi:hypothetical protein